jgi:hypothetical protein
MAEKEKGVDRKLRYDALRIPTYFGEFRRKAANSTAIRSE